MTDFDFRVNKSFKTTDSGVVLLTGCSLHWSSFSHWQSMRLSVILYCCQDFMDTVDLGSLHPHVPLRGLAVSHRTRAKGREGMNNQSSISSAQGLPSPECEVTLSMCAVCPPFVENWQKFLCPCIPQECFRNAIHVILIMRHRIKG